MNYKAIAKELKKATNELRILKLESTYFGRLQLSFERSIDSMIWYGDIN